MFQRLRQGFGAVFRFPRDRIARILPRVLLGLGTLVFVLVVTSVLALEDIFPGFSDISTLQVNDIATRNIIAPEAPPFVSDILTEQARRDARNSVQPVFDPPDPNTARQQTELLIQILEFIENIRRDSFATEEQKIADINQITALTLGDPIIRLILQMDDESWSGVRDEMINVLPRVMRESIRPGQIQSVRDQLPTQVSIRFDPQERDVIVAILEDLVRPNTFENPEATEEAHIAAEEAVPDVLRSFERGQIIVRENDRIDPLAYEALEQLGLLRTDEFRLLGGIRAFLAALIGTIIAGLYIWHFQPKLLDDQRGLLGILAFIFLVMLVMARFLGVHGNIYLFPWSALALLFVAVVGKRIAILASLGLAFFSGLIANNSLELVSLIAFGGIMGSLTLTRSERLNSFFVTGALIGITNAVVVAIFFLNTPVLQDNLEVYTPFFLSLLSGILLVPATAIAVMYVVTLIFNLSTPLKMLDLSQPSKPLLQRLLREAPGSYQHSLQVANLAEQAASAIGADAQLTHVAALYHDIGKMMNPIYFTENQQGIGNPHEALNDPYRSADIIIGHVTDGDVMAKKYRLPNRIRDFIREHHGTSRVFVFFQQALDEVDGDESLVDVSAFMYPGPRPRSRETAVLMLADSCEAAVRSVKPNTREAISDLVNNIIEDKRKHGQLDESGLTLNDLKHIRSTFIEVLQGIFHPRINYQEAVSKSRKRSRPDDSLAQKESASERVITSMPGEEELRQYTRSAPSGISSNVTDKSSGQPASEEAAKIVDEEDDAPLEEVPRLPRAGSRQSEHRENGQPLGDEAVSDVDEGEETEKADSG